VKPEDIKTILSQEIQNFIREHENDDLKKLLLKHHKENLPLSLIAEQIKCRVKAKKKFPTFSNKLLLYESTAFEQSSSEATAIFKKTFMSGESIVDLTGGLGIDLLTISSEFDKVTYCELNPSLVELFKYNSLCFRKKNVNVFEGDSIEHLKNTKEVYDWIYLDPARRSEDRRSVDLDYCSPNVYENLDLLKSKARKICIKVSPAFDFDEAVKRIPGLTKYIVVSVKNECKEVLLILDELSVHKTVIRQAVSLDEFGNVSFDLNDEGFSPASRSLGKAEANYFYEPDVAILKADISDCLILKHPLRFINNISDFMISDFLVPDFPGRAFKIESIIPFKVDSIKKHLKDNSIRKANISRRHFPLNVDEIRKKIKLAEGGDDYLFFTKDNNDHPICYFTKKVTGTLSDV